MPACWLLRRRRFGSHSAIQRSTIKSPLASTKAGPDDNTHRSTQSRWRKDQVRLVHLVLGTLFCPPLSQSLRKVITSSRLLDRRGRSSSTNSLAQILSVITGQTPRYASLNITTWLYRSLLCSCNTWIRRGILKEAILHRRGGLCCHGSNSPEQLRKANRAAISSSRGFLCWRVMFWPLTLPLRVLFGRRQLRKLHLQQLLLVLLLLLLLSSPPLLLQHALWCRFWQQLQEGRLIGRAALVYCGGRANAVVHEASKRRGAVQVPRPGCCTIQLLGHSVRGSSSSSISNPSVRSCRIR